MIKTLIWAAQISFPKNYGNCFHVFPISHEFRAKHLSHIKIVLNFHLITCPWRQSLLQNALQFGRKPEYAQKKKEI